MMDRETFQKKILSVRTENDFNACALDLFHYQYRHNEVYRRYVDQIGVNPLSIQEYMHIPCLPISLFKSQRVSSVDQTLFNKAPYSTVFKSSGTSMQERSSHYVYDTQWYEKVALRAFEHFFGSIEQYVIIAYLPSYYENKQSSLLHMVNYFMAESHMPLSGYYDFEKEDVVSLMQRCMDQGKRPWIIGVTYALLDWIEFNAHLRLDPSVVLVETGGMKGRREEILREELHQRLKASLGLPKIYSEYGMCELLSQAYCFDNEEFNSAPWLRFTLREVNDPFTAMRQGNGLIKAIDLANIDSCAFIETQDLGSISSLGALKILGRVDNSDLRGCNLLYQN